MSLASPRRFDPQKSVIRQRFESEIPFDIWATPPGLYSSDYSQIR